MFEIVFSSIIASYFTLLLGSFFLRKRFSEQSNGY